MKLFFSFAGTEDANQGSDYGFWGQYLKVRLRPDLYLFSFSCRVATSLQRRRDTKISLLLRRRMKKKILSKNDDNKVTQLHMENTRH